MKRARHQQGSVVFDRRRKVWNYLFSEGGSRRTKRIGPLHEYPTKAKAQQAAELMRQNIAAQKKTQPIPTILTVNALTDGFRKEKMDVRSSTRRAYESWLHNHILPFWGQRPIEDLQPRPVELWLGKLDLTPKSRVHIRGVIRRLWDYAMWAKHTPIGRNPMELVSVKDASKRWTKPRSLTVEQFQQFIPRLPEPFHLIALSCVCFGLRISEALALRWSDVDWDAGMLKVERGIVRQIVDDVKTDESRKELSIDTAMLTVLHAWKRTTAFAAPADWIFASPVQKGRLPWSYPRVWKVFQDAAKAAGIGKLATHTMRHTYRSWLDAVGTPVAVQQKLMRHADIRTTMNTYGDVVTDEMQQANSKVAGLALGRAVVN